MAPTKDSSAAYDMYGITGLTRYGPISRVYEEFLRELQGPAGMRSYREMMDNDPISGAILFSANHLCRKVEFRFKPKDDSNEARRAADLCGGAIFDDLEATWPDTISEILTMLPFGWALLEFDMKRRLGESPGDSGFDLLPVDYKVGAQEDKKTEFVPSRFKDGLVGFRSWSLRSQETLFQWEFDERSNATVMEQMAPPDYRIRRIPLAKSFLFRTTVAKNNPEGRSLLRNAWTSYYFKKNIQVFEGIGIERNLAGYPVIQVLPPDLQKGMAVPDIWNTKDPEMVTLLSILQKIVRSVRQDEQEGMVLPWWCEFKFLSAATRRSFDTNAIISRYDQRIAMSVLADFIMLGHEAVGSKALAATKISLFTSALSAFLDNVCAIITRKAVPILMQFNGIPVELSPTMEHGDVESINLQELGDFIAKIVGTGFNPLASPDAQRAIMELAKLPTTGISNADSGVGDLSEGEGGSPGGAVPVDAPGTSQGNLSTVATT